MDNNEKIYYRHYTKAIKNGKTFAFIFCRRCPPMRGDEFTSARGAAKEISLGSFDPAYFTLIYAVVAGATDRDFVFNDPAKHAINVIQHAFRLTRISVIWTFLALPAHRAVLTQHLTTVPDHDLMEGFSADKCVEHFKWASNELGRELIVTVSNEIKVAPREISDSDFTYFGVGTTEVGDQWRQFREKIAGKGLMPNQ